MQRLIVMITGCLLLAAKPAMAELNIFACEPEWASLADELAGDKIQVFTATTALQDVHHIQARPRLIAKMRRADLVVCTGADLEAGWLPLLLRKAGNPDVQPGKPGYFEASAQVERLDIPDQVDRAMGDVHAAGNPHVHLDPHRLLVIAKALGARLSEIDATNAAYYQSRLADFTQRWQQAIQEWENRAAALRGINTVTHHKDWLYLFDWLDMHSVATLEPKPGLPPTTTHLANIKNQLQAEPARMIIRAAYNNGRAAKWLNEQTGLPIVVLPYTVGGNENARDLFSLFDETLGLLLRATP